MHGRRHEDFDEGPSPEDLERFGSDEFDPRELDDNPDRHANAPFRRKVIIFIGSIFALLIVLAMSGLLTL